MTEGLVTRLAESLTGPVTIVGTGGLACAIAGVASCFHAVKPDLLLEGLQRLYCERLANEP
jgi:type III pantothenate kinase